MPKLYLIPTHLGDENYNSLFPAFNNDIIKQLKVFIVENARTARRFISSLNLGIDISSLEFYELNNHTSEEEISGYSFLLIKQDVGLISEAGVPCVADPGNRVVLMAHRKNIEVIPLIGPSSILMALMASGLNGQKFAFHGYLPIDKGKKAKVLQQLEVSSRQNEQAQIFMETPYRNEKMFEDLLQQCQATTLLCLAVNITHDNQYIRTKTIAEWKKEAKPNVNKVPAVFVLQAF